MMRTLRRVVPAATVVALLVAAAGCGGDDKPAGEQPDRSSTATAPTDGTTPSNAPGSSPPAKPVRAGLPTGFPESDVPLVDGVAVGSGGTAKEGHKGWVVQIKRSKAAEDCFNDAADKLTDDGFDKVGEVTVGDSEQAQFTSTDYAVIVTATGVGEGACVVGYKVGQVSR